MNMVFKPKIRRVVFGFLLGVVWTVSFWLAATALPVELSLAVLCVTTVLALKDKIPAQCGLNLAAWFAGAAISAAVEFPLYLHRMILPDRNSGDGLGIVLLLPIFLAAGSLTITASIVVTLIISGNK